MWSSSDAVSVLPSAAVMGTFRCWSIRSIIFLCCMCRAFNSQLDDIPLLVPQRRHFPFVYLRTLSIYESIREVCWEERATTEHISQLCKVQHFHIVLFTSREEKSYHKGWTTDTQRYNIQLFTTANKSATHTHILHSWLHFHDQRIWKGSTSHGGKREQAF